jgi:hypothetical protein
MNIFIFLIGASVFSVGGMGEDKAVFQLPFYGPQNKAQLQFFLKPEFDITTENGDFRGRFWTNPFIVNLQIPVRDRILISAGNAERFDQSSDIYLHRDPLTMHLRAEGGMEEIRGQVNFNLPIAEIFGRGSYLFGGAREIWQYEMGDYSTVDTFSSAYYGSVFCAGLRFRFAAVAYEGLGRVTMARTQDDTSFDIPRRLTIGLTPVFGNYQLKFIFEHSFWNGYDSPNRVQVGLTRAGYHFAYSFNPWYYHGINEHGLSVTRSISIKKIGFIGLDLQASYRSRGGLKEFKIVPEFKLTLEEIFSRRQK